MDREAYLSERIKNDPPKYKDGARILSLTILTCWAGLNDFGVYMKSYKVYNERSGRVEPVEEQELDMLQKAEGFINTNQTGG